jgi:REP element-mobilizing transposase RayT
LALNGTANHVHLLVGLADSCPALFIGEIKGGSSFVVNAQQWNDNVFKWQGEYSVHSVSRWDKVRVQGYIDRQKEHHAQGTTIPRLELPPFEQMRS